MSFFGLGWFAVLQAHPPQSSTEAAKPQAEIGGRRKKIFGRVLRRNKREDVPAKLIMKPDRVRRG